MLLLGAAMLLIGLLSLFRSEASFRREGGTLGGCPLRLLKVGGVEGGDEDVEPPLLTALLTVLLMALLLAPLPPLTLLTPPAFPPLILTVKLLVFALRPSDVVDVVDFDVIEVEAFFSPPLPSPLPSPPPPPPPLVGVATPGSTMVTRFGEGEWASSLAGVPRWLRGDGAAKFRLDGLIAGGGD